MTPALIITASAAVLVAAASAEPATSQTKPQYEPAPAAMDARLSASDVSTREDAAKLAEAEFLIADVNLDGAVDAAEFGALAKASTPAGEAGAARMTAKSPTPEEAFAAISKGKLSFSKADLVAARTASFDKADADKSKTLNDAEKKKFAVLLAVRSASEEF